jgi:HD-GYP domain-containing protein (c-di-GMP phosphodiesterase class II)
MAQRKKFVIKQATRDRCQIIEVNDLITQKRFAAVSVEMFHFLYEIKRIDFSLYFRINNEMVEFLKPNEVSKENLDALWGAINHSSNVLQLYVLKGEHAKFERFIQSIMQSKLQSFKHAGGHVDEKTIHVYGNLSSASQMIVRGGINASVAKNAQDATSILLDSQLNSDAATDTISRMINHDPTLYDHSATVAMFSAIISTQFMRKPLDKKAGKLVAQCGLFHDAGKSCVPNHVLNKPGKLDVEEFEIMKTHTTLGRNELQKAIDNGADIDEIVPLIAYQHHERFTGCGYPQGKVGRAEEDPDHGIHQFARIVTIADVYSALLMKRVYKDAMSSDKALGIMIKASEREYDPIIFEDFMSGVAKSIKYRKKKEDEDSGLVTMIGENDSFQNALKNQKAARARKKIK